MKHRDDPNQGGKHCFACFFCLFFFYKGGDKFSARMEKFYLLYFGDWGDIF